MSVTSGNEIDGIIWIAVEMNCTNPSATKVRIIHDERIAFLLGAQFLVFEKLPGIRDPRLVPYETRQSWL